MVIAEGGGLLVLEELERAQARGARIYAEVAGFAQTTDAVSLKHFAEDGVQYARAMRLALEVGGLGPDDVDYVNADGHGTALGDRAEARALRALLGDRAGSVPVSAPKSMTGNALAGAGPIDASFALLAMQHGRIPPTINLDEQDPECDVRSRRQPAGGGDHRRRARRLARRCRRECRSRAQTHGIVAERRKEASCRKSHCG